MRLKLKLESDLILHHTPDVKFGVPINYGGLCTWTGDSAFFILSLSYHTSSSPGSKPP